MQSAAFRPERLFRQTGGFEGCLNLVPAKAERFSSHDLPAAEPVRDKGTVLKPSIAPGHPTRQTPQGDDLFAAVVEPVDFPTPIRQQVPLRSNHRGNFVPATPRARLDSSRVIDVFAFGIAERDQLIDVPAVPGIDRSTHDLDVLLRHRPRNIPQPGGRGCERNAAQRKTAERTAPRVPLMQSKEKRLAKEEGERPHEDQMGLIRTPPISESPPGRRILGAIWRWISDRLVQRALVSRLVRPSR